jgi:hypothetical protein
MGPTRSGMPDTRGASKSTGPIPRNRAGRPVGAIALPPTFPKPTGAAPAPIAATATRNPTAGSAPWPVSDLHDSYPSNEQPRRLDPLHSPADRL